MKSMKASGLMLLIVLLAGCANQQPTTRAQKLFEPSYKPVSGDVYENGGVKFIVGVPLRTFGSESYFYAVKKSQSPFVSSHKYLMFDITVHNPLQRSVSIPLEKIQLVGQNHEIYLPLRSIQPDTNKSRFLLRNLNDYRTSPTMYGLIVFEPLPEWEKEVKLQFQIDMDDDFENHYVLFKYNEPDAAALAEWNTVQKQNHARARFIRDHQDDQGYIKPADIDKLNKFEMR